jgi:CBS domain-containing protein
MKNAEEMILEKNRAMITIDASDPVKNALNLMVKHKIGAVLVTEENKIVGIWTERDLLNNILNPQFDLQSSRIGDHMTMPVKTARHDTPLLKLKEMFLGLYIRHIVIEKKGKHIGLLSIGDVLRASLLEQDRQIKELNAIASWEYYENWGWHHSKQ